MKSVKRLLSFIVVFMVVMVALCSVSFAATVGQQLTSPEAGWQRIDDRDSRIAYIGSWSTNTSIPSRYYNQTIIGSTELNASFKFKFKGTKLRIISFYDSVLTSSIDIYIDGAKENFALNVGTTTLGQVIAYEKTGLIDTVHTVEVINKGSGKTISLDAIDIDSAGYLVDYYQPTLVSATPAVNSVNLVWNPIDGATGYNVKMATSPNGTYTTVATNVSGTSYTVPNLNSSTTYYFVVSSIHSNIESSNSNELSTTTSKGNSAILVINLSNGTEKEYVLNDTQLKLFLDWHEERSSGTGKAYYTFTKNYNIKPFLSRKEYISFDKISSFEVNEYAE